jgi:hypothetical protein
MCAMDKTGRKDGIVSEENNHNNEPNNERQGAFPCRFSVNVK